jgi:hypothetical protein
VRKLPPAQKEFGFAGAAGRRMSGKAPAPSTTSTDSTSSSSNCRRLQSTCSTDDLNPSSNAENRTRHSSVRWLILRRGDRQGHRRDDGRNASRRHRQRRRGSRRQGKEERTEPQFDWPLVCRQRLAVRARRRGGAMEPLVACRVGKSGDHDAISTICPGQMQLRGQQTDHDVRCAREQLRDVARSSRIQRNGSRCVANSIWGAVKTNGQDADDQCGQVYRLP